MTRPKVLVVVEDDTAIRTLIGKALGTAYTVYEARDGEEGRLLLEGPSVDGLVCDIMMPRLDGLTLAQIAQADAETLPPADSLFDREGIDFGRRCRHQRRGTTLPDQAVQAARAVGEGSSHDQNEEHPLSALSPALGGRSTTWRPPRSLLGATCTQTRQR